MNGQEENVQELTTTTRTTRSMRRQDVLAQQNIPFSLLCFCNLLVIEFYLLFL